jgi:uncharacterized protein DUF2795
MAELANLDEIRRFLEGVTYPISKPTLLETSREAGASDRILQTIGLLPDEIYRDHSGLHADLEHLVRTA